ncbi:lactam utilization protein LamB [Helicobacter sp. 13S00401-1]|uniref:5-oxoprolinase subunit PxpA n=1 Tax=Helicobacter sp. 13S00401-1 TaxID=1905758 RepID=UPI000BA51944|nr:5-oxoprolinase subunit PxpA [Helicobacter sp. 13S00401-1]PAF50398.1 lactam utilization protein LamB [Helicobacter sp. 13S00401-1]
MKTFIDFNSDMGENFGAWVIGDGVDSEIVKYISSANIACGFHAGDPNIMEQTVLSAKANNVGIGAHPGFRDLVGFGRRLIKEEPKTLVNDVLYQLGALKEMASLHGETLSHVKLHGALYLHSVLDEGFAYALVEALQKQNATLPIIGFSSKNCYLQKAATEAKHPYIKELLVDRDYDDDGNFVLVRKARAYTPSEVKDKVELALKKGCIKSVTGKEIDIDFETMCIHSDTIGCLSLIKAVKEALDDNNITIRRATC